jgi:hypothetical protein
MGSRYKGSQSEVRALDTLIKLMRAAESVNVRLNRFISRAGLTVSQFGALEALYHLGPLCQSELGEKILKSSGNITMVVDNLEKPPDGKRRRPHRGDLSEACENDLLRDGGADRFRAGNARPALQEAGEALYGTGRKREGG